jgi:hypothetical protein
MKSLQTLSLTNTSVGDAGLARLKALPALERLNLSGNTRVTNAGLKALADFPTLVDFRLQSRLVTDDGLVAFKACKKLRYLSLQNAPVTKAGLAHLSGMKRLLTLGLFGSAVGDDSLDTLKGFTGLQALDIVGTKVTKAGARELSAALPGCQIISDHGTFGPLKGK